MPRGDRIAAASDGPTIVVRLAGAAAGGVAPTVVARPSSRRTRGPRGVVATVALAALAVAAIATTVVVQRHASARVLAADALRAAADSRGAPPTATRGRSRVRRPRTAPARQPVSTRDGTARSARRRSRRGGEFDAGRDRALRAACDRARRGRGGGRHRVERHRVRRLAARLLVTNRHVVVGANGDAPRRSP